MCNQNYLLLSSCKNVLKYVRICHYAKRTEVCTCHDLNGGIPLSHKIKHSMQKKDILKQVHVPSIEKMSTFCVVMWMNTNLVCKMFFTCFFIPQTLIWNGSNGNQLQKLPNQGKEILDVLPFAANGNDYLVTADEQKLSVYKWMNV